MAQHDTDAKMLSVVMFVKMPCQIVIQKSILLENSDTHSHTHAPQAAFFGKEMNIFSSIKKTFTEMSKGTYHLR